MLNTALWIGGVVLALFLIDRVALWAEDRGWIYWRMKRAQSSAMSSILISLDVVTNPAAQHVVEAKQAKKLEERDNGDDDPPRV
jgi:hypothetical protein